MSVYGETVKGGVKPERVSVIHGIAFGSSDKISAGILSCLLLQLQYLFYFIFLYLTYFVFSMYVLITTCNQSSKSKIKVKVFAITFSRKCLMQFNVLRSENFSWFLFPSHFKNILMFKKRGIITSSRRFDKLSDRPGRTGLQMPLCKCPGGLGTFGTD